MIGARVDVIEGDPGLSARIVRAAEAEGMVATALATAAAFGTRRRAPEAHALVIAATLPDADGRDVCSALRARGAATPILILASTGTLPDRLAAFAAGADDCLAPPVATAELVARLRVLIRRGWRAPDLRAAPVCLDPVAHAVEGRDGRVGLTPIEFRILARLALHPGEAVRRVDLIRAAWSDGAIVNDNTLDAHVARLRRKLAAAGSDPVITTAHRVGYSLAREPAGDPPAHAGLNGSTELRAPGRP